MRIDDRGNVPHEDCDGSGELVVAIAEAAVLLVVVEDAMACVLALEEFEDGGDVVEDAMA